MASTRLSTHVKNASSKRLITTSVLPNLEFVAPDSQPATEILRYENGLLKGNLIRRYKRFLGDVQFHKPANAQAVDAVEAKTVHVPNTGPMTGLLENLPVPAILSRSDSIKRKYAHTLEWVRPEAEGTWVGVHSAKANTMVRQLLLHRQLLGIPDYASLQTEVKYGSDGRSRVDFVLHDEAGSRTYVEVKSVSFAEKIDQGAKRIALFPDTVSTRGQRHVRELTALVRAGEQAALVFLVQRDDCSEFALCHDKDPVYGQLVVEAVSSGVIVIAVACRLDASEGVIRYHGELPVRLDYKR